MDSNNIKHFQKKSRFNNNRDSYVDDNGDLVYLTWVQEGSEWHRREVCRIPYAEIEAAGKTEIVFLVDESHREMDLQRDRDERHADKIIAAYKAEETGDDGIEFAGDPIEQIADPQGDLFDQLYPEPEPPENPQIAIIRKVIESLSPVEQEMFWEKYGEMASLEDIRKADLEKYGKALTQQAYSKRCNKIIAKACEALGVEKPRKRSK